MKRVNTEIKERIKLAVGKDVQVFACVATENAKLPYVIYRCEGFDIERTKDGIESYQNRYLVSVYSDKFDQADSLAEKVIETLEGYRGKSIISSKLTGGGDPGYNDCYEQVLNFDIESR